MSDGFWEELKRRKVVRVATMYVVVAWVVLQLGDVVIEPLGLPTWMQAGLIVGVTAGFPVVLVLSWLFDITWGGLRRDRGPKADPKPIAADTEDVGRSRHRLAVLPFIDLSEARADTYLGDGIAEEILHALAAIPLLDVIARASSFRFRGLEVDLPQMQEQLGVTHVLSGSVRRGGDRLRVKAELIDVATQSHVWSERYQRGVEDLFALQEEVAGQVASTLVGVLGVAHERSWDMEPKAYDEFLLAVADIRSADFPQAIEHGERSVSFDPENPRAHGLLAEAYLEWPRYGYATGTDELTLARFHSNEALRIDHGYAPARIVRGMLSLYLERDFAAAYDEVSSVALERGKELEFVPTLLGYANRFDEAAQIERRMSLRDPLNVPSLISHARKLNWLRRTPEAQDTYARARRIQPLHILMIQDDIELALRAGRVEEAAGILEKAASAYIDSQDGPDSPTTWLPLKATLLWVGAKIEAGRGNFDKAHEMAVVLEADGDVTPTIKAEAYLTAGDVDAAYRLCDLGIRQFDIGMYDVAYPYVVRGPDDAAWLRFRDDPRYPDFLRRLGIDEESLAGVKWRKPAEFIA